MLVDIYIYIYIYKYNIQYNIEDILTVVLYTYTHRHVGTPKPEHTIIGAFIESSILLYGVFGSGYKPLAKTRAGC